VAGTPGDGSGAPFITLTADRETVDVRSPSTTITVSYPGGAEVPVFASVFDDRGERVWSRRVGMEALETTITLEIPTNTLVTYTAHVTSELPESCPPEDPEEDEERLFASTVLVSNIGWHGSVGLSTEVERVTSASQPIELTAVLSHPLLAGYQLGVYDEASVRLHHARQGSGTVVRFRVTPGVAGQKTYTAYVGDEMPPDRLPTGGVRAHAVLVFTGGRLTSQQMVSVDLDALVRRVAGRSDAEIMDVISASTAASRELGGEASDQAEAFRAAREAGASRQEAFRRAALTPYGRDHLLWDLWERTSPHGPPAPPSPLDRTAPRGGPVEIPLVPPLRTDGDEEWLALRFLERDG
jgi:hypothetical protein